MGFCDTKYYLSMEVKSALYLCLCVNNQNFDSAMMPSADDPPSYFSLPHPTTPSSHPSLIHTVIPGLLRHLESVAAGEGNSKCALAHIKCSWKTEQQRGPHENTARWLSRRRLSQPKARNTRPAAASITVYSMQMHRQYWSRI